MQGGVHLTWVQMGCSVSSFVLFLSCVHPLNSKLLGSWSWPGKSRQLSCGSSGTRRKGKCSTGITNNVVFCSRAALSAGSQSSAEQLRQGNVAQDLTQWYGGKMPLAMPRTVFLSRGTKQDSVPSA